MNELQALTNLVLAPYVMKATALIGVSRKVGGNQFRHAFSTLGILLDYRFFDRSVLLKAALLHDLLEDLPKTQVRDIRYIDEDSDKVVELVLEVTRRNNETKPEYLSRVLNTGSEDAHLLKCADRISNLTDLHRSTHSDQKISDYLDQTEEYVLPMARKVNKNMVIELSDLVAKRRELLKALEGDK